MFDKPEFAALSYVWGDCGELAATHRIRIGQHDFKITKNCEMALTAIVQAYGPTIIWVDSICIDQSNLRERNHQVRLMGSIYEHAHTVFIWLGPDSALLRQSIEYVKTLAQDQTSEFSFAQTQLLRPFLKNDWFGRGWTFQEFVLATKPVFLTGSASLERSELLRAAEYLHDQGPEARWYRGSEESTSAYGLTALMDLWRLIGISTGSIEATPGYWTTIRLIASDWNLPLALGHLLLLKIGEWIILLFIYMISFLQVVFWHQEYRSSFYNRFIVWSIEPLVQVHAHVQKMSRKSTLARTRLYKSLSSIGWIIAFNATMHDPRLPRYLQIFLPIWYSLCDPFIFAYSRESHFADGILQSIRTRAVTDPKDKAFAFYGVLQKLGAHLTPPDYTKLASTIHYDFFLDLLAWKSCSIALLVEAGISCDTTGPSWVPKWHLPSYCSWVPDGLFYHATVGSNSDRTSSYGPPTYSILGSALTVRGFHMYRVVNIIRLPPRHMRDTDLFAFDCRLIDAIARWVLSPRWCQLDPMFASRIQDTPPITASVWLLIAHTGFSFNDRQ